MLEEAIDFVDLDWLVNACAMLAEYGAEASHQLLHIRVNERFASEYFDFASDYVQQAVYKRLYEKNKQKLFEFIATSDGLGPLAVLRGHLFEGYVHSVLPRGGTFRVRRLVDNNEECEDEENQIEEESEGEDEDSDDGADAEDGDDVAMEANTATINAGARTVSIARCDKTVVFYEKSEIVAAANTSYLRPASKTFESIDAIIKPDALFQVTDVHKHPCKQKGLYDVLKLLGNPAAPRLYFVVPPDRFANFRYQRYLNSSRKKEPMSRKRMRTQNYENMRKIQQFAMEVKFGSE